MCPYRQKQERKEASQSEGHPVAAHSKTWLRAVADRVRRTAEQLICELCKRALAEPSHKLLTPQIDLTMLRRLDGTCLAHA